ncbi:MAG TPA: protein-export chaperone SecB [Burkholderiales bacterium]|jgi:preprotein translocase subunit SecB|nr:protein-export chaperone SecB [Burkholderiales bacterium]
MSESRPVFSIEKLYVKDLSLEIPNAPKIFLERESPQIDVQLHTKGGPFGDEFYEVVLTVTITAKINENTMFLVEAAQAGIFRIQNVQQKDIEPLLGIACPNILFPYARETISDVVTRAGFPPVILNPMNFEALYQQKQAASSEQATH